MLEPRPFASRVAVLGTAGLVAVAIFMGTLTYWQVFRSDLATHANNPRLVLDFKDPNRGRILDRQGNVLAESLDDGTRKYTDLSAAHVVGYLDARFGGTGAELAFDQALSGHAPASWAGAIKEEFHIGADPAGLDVRLTLDPVVQRVAAQALGDRAGAVVALDPRNGDVLAMVSVPTFDPGAVATDGEALFADAGSPLVNRATQGLYPPGSTFKAVTAASALEQGIIKPETMVNCPGEVVIDGFPIRCDNVSQGIGTYPFKAAFTFSVNAIFAKVGASLGWPSLLDTAGRFGFGSRLEFILDTEESQVANPGSDLSQVLLASTAFGQGELLVTPLQMAVVAATIANGGVRMRPRIGLAAYDGDEPLRELEPVTGGRVIDPAVAGTLRDFMISVVENQQASGVSLPGIKVGGKTGTAETGRGPTHAWFIAFAPAEEPRIALAVVVEDGGRGSQVAAPIAGTIISAALNR